MTRHAFSGTGQQNRGESILGDELGELGEEEEEDEDENENEADSGALSRWVGGISGIDTGLTHKGGEGRSSNHPDTSSSFKNPKHRKRKKARMMQKGDERLLNARDNVGNTPIHLAASGGHEKVVEVLCSYGAEIEARNLAGRTPLHVACMNAHLGVIKLLLDIGADARTRDREMRRPADMCPLPEVYDALLSGRSSVQCVSGGPTPFGHGDSDTHVKLNERDHLFAAITHPRVLVGTSAPNFLGCRLPKVRPITPLRPYRAYGRGPEWVEGTSAPDGGAAERKVSVL